MWLVLFACGGSGEGAAGDAVSGDAASGGTDERPTADQVLLAHNRATGQCTILEKESYLFNWVATMEDGHSDARVEQIVHQGKPGFSYTRIHQRREPAAQFAAFGRTPEGKFWSATNGGVQPDLPEEAAAALVTGMDPTPVCNYDKRWPKRELVGPEDRDGAATWHIQVSWVDGTKTDMWFDRASKVLRESEARVGETVTTTKLQDYQDFGGVKWPKTEVAIRAEGPLKITTTQTLDQLKTNIEGYAEIGPRQVQAILATAGGAQ